jgi:hypothetical protein
MRLPSFRVTIAGIEGKTICWQSRIETANQKRAGRLARAFRPLQGRFVSDSVAAGRDGARRRVPSA